MEEDPWTMSLWATGQRGGGMGCHGCYWSVRRWEAGCPQFILPHGGVSTCLGDAKLAADSEVTAKNSHCN